MKYLKVKPLCLTIGMALAGSASAATIDFSGTNFYMKFLDGSQQGQPTGSIDTSSGADQGQFTELNLIFKATISPQVEAGGRIQSRSSAAYWTEFGGFGKENSIGADEVNHQKFMKLRGAYVELTPGYRWLNLARVGTSDWGMFDPFTMGKIRYIDRDNFNGFYFKGPLAGGSWEAARVSLPEYLGVNFNAGTAPKNQAIYIGQFKQSPGNVNLMEGVTYLNVQDKNPADTNMLDGQGLQDRFKNTILSLKADSAVTDGLDIRGAIHHSMFNIDNPNVVAGMLTDFCYGPGLGCGSTSTSYLTTGVMGYSMTPGADVTGNAVKLDLDWRPAAADRLSINYQYFNIGSGYVSIGGARRESDVLLTEGSEAAWYGWGQSQWLGGRANDMQQAAVIHVDNAYTDFDEPGSESVIGWKGHTFKFNYETANTPMSLELTKVGYNTNWQNYGGNANIYDVGHGQGTYDVYRADQDRATNILAFKLNHIFSVMGGLDTNFKYKRVSNKDSVSTTTAADDTKVLDNGMTFSAGNQLFSQLYGTLSYGRYIRKNTLAGVDADITKSIYGVRLAYNLPGFEVGMLTQWIHGFDGPATLRQYRMKTFAQVNF